MANDHAGRIAAAEANIESSFRRIDALTAKVEKLGEVVTTLRLDWAKDRVKLAGAVGAIVWILSTMGNLGAAILLRQFFGGGG